MRQVGSVNGMVCIKKKQAGHNECHHVLGKSGEGRSGALREAVTLKKRALRQLTAARPVGGTERHTSREV